MSSLVIGIAGGTGSGKTTIANKLFQAFGDKAVMLSHDFYYKPFENMSIEERSKQNFDHPDSLETDLLVEHLKQLKSGHAIKHPCYDFETYSRKNWELTNPAPIIIIEGILIFTSKDLCDLCDIKLFVDTDADIRFIRRLRRDVQERGRNMDSVINQYLSTVKPMHQQFVEPSKSKADLIIPEGGQNDIAISMIIESISKKLSKNSENKS